MGNQTTIEVLRIPGTLFPRGAYDEAADYKFLNFVESGGNGYVCLQPCTGIPVTNTAYWFKFVFRGEKGDAFTYADLTAEQKAELVRDATAAAQAAASSAQSAADDAAAALQKFNTIKAAIDALDPTSTEGSIQTLAAKQGLLESELDALGPELEQLEAKNFAEVENAPSADLLIADENDKVLAIFSEGELKTKKFDSSKVSQVEDADVAADFSVTDENGKNIISILYGYPMTKNFNGRAISRKLNTLEQEIATPNIEEWSKMPKLGQNPLDIVRFDGGMSRIFKNWAFIGDSLNSGEMYGYNDNVITIEEGNVGKEISVTGLVANASYTTTSLYAVSGYKPRIRITFANSDGLDGKILIAKAVSENEYVTLATGVAGTNVYTTDVSANTNIVVSYPSNNKPIITFGITYVSDMYSLSWGQQMVRLLGSKGYNYSVGGESCKRWCTGTNNGRRWERMQVDMQTEVIDAVTIALGVNDKGYWLSGSSSTVDYPCVTAYPQKSQYGSLTLTQEEVLDDIDFSDYTNNSNSYAGWYAGIIQRIKSLSPKTHIFCITNPASASEWNQVIRILASKFTELYPNTVWVIDLERYTDDFSQISANCDLHGHWSAFGYLYAAYEISTYIDWLIRNNISAFRATSLIGVANEHKWEV